MGFKTENTGKQIKQSDVSYNQQSTGWAVDDNSSNNSSYHEHIQILPWIRFFTLTKGPDRIWNFLSNEVSFIKDTPRYIELFHRKLTGKGLPELGSIFCRNIIHGLSKHTAFPTRIWSIIERSWIWPITLMIATGKEQRITPWTGKMKAIENINQFNLAIM